MGIFLDCVGEELKKQVQAEILRRAYSNVKLLEMVQEQYEPNAYPDIAVALPTAYRRAAKFLGGINTIDRRTQKPIQHCYSPQTHFHETLCGLLVRSKSEVIIVNTLTNYGIPFDYERQFSYPDERGVFFRPDFTFEFPDGSLRIWEHLGLMKNLEYSEHTGRKLMVYQRYGYLIGRNLILTQDDEQGNCSSAYIDEVVRTQILPYFK